MCSESRFEYPVCVTTLLCLLSLAVFITAPVKLSKGRLLADPVGDVLVGVVVGSVKENVSTVYATRTE